MASLLRGPRDLRSAIVVPLAASIVVSFTVARLTIDDQATKLSNRFNTPPGHAPDRARLVSAVRGPTARSWVLRYRFAGQQRDLGLGSAFDVSLVKARDLRDDARTLMRQGSLTLIMRYL